MDTFSDKLWLLLLGVLTVGGLAILFAPLAKNTNHGSTAEPFSHSASHGLSSPNVITAATSRFSLQLNYKMQSLDYGFNDALESLASIGPNGTKAIKDAASGSLERIGTLGAAPTRFIRTGAHLTAQSIYAVADGYHEYSVQTTQRTLSTAANTSGYVLALVTENPLIEVAIKPGEAESLPVIDPRAATVAAIVTPMTEDDLQVLPSPAPISEVKSVWPMRGLVTTPFGVDHEPFQKSHTGIDISDGQPSGVTPILSFRSGRVIEATYSKVGLGNHVTVDHGNGLTSIYAHLYSILVNEGQEVGTETVLGTQGSTGVSTGPHLHFEIWKDGTNVDPHQYIPGQP